MESSPRCIVQWERYHVKQYKYRIFSFLWYDFPVEHLSLHHSLFLHFSVLLSLSFMFSLCHPSYLSSFYLSYICLPFFLPSFSISLFLFSLPLPSFFHSFLPRSFPSFLLSSLASFLPSLFFFFLICLYIEKLWEGIWEMFPVVVSSERDFIFIIFPLLYSLNCVLKAYVAILTLLLWSKLSIPPVLFSYLSRSCTNQ